MSVAELLNLKKSVITSDALPKDKDIILDAINSRLSKRKDSSALVEKSDVDLSDFN
jgi:hypothetical protein